MIRHNLLENMVLRNRKRYFRNANRRKEKLSKFPDVGFPLFSSFVNYLVGSIQNIKLTAWRIKITAFVVLPHTATTYCAFS